MPAAPGVGLSARSQAVAHEPPALLAQQRESTTLDNPVTIGGTFVSERRGELVWVGRRASEPLDHQAVDVHGLDGVAEVVGGGRPFSERARSGASRPRSR